MNAYKRYKNRLERFLQTERGKRFINYAYSFGAAIVILGAMFKLLYFPFGNEMLFIGLVTECIVFILSAFDSPVRDYRWEHIFPALTSDNPDESAGMNVGIIQRSATKNSEDVRSSESSDSQSFSGFSQDNGGAAARSDFGMASQLSSHTEEYGRQLESINRTLSGLNSIYEVQLKSISSQIGSIEQINQGLSRLRNMYGDNFPDGSVIRMETEKMADQLRELNEVYARMLHAMTVSRNDNQTP